MPRRQPEPRAYYLDANLDGPELLRRLRDGGMRCERHRDHFAQDAEDEVWIPEVASNGWIIVTRDVAIQRRPAERDAWVSAGAVVLMVRGDKLSTEDMAKMLLAAHANGRLDGFLAKRLAPIVIHLHTGGRFEVKYGGERRGGQKK
jgi:predicted nuclease of predicted toxin-antitoxin system